MAFNYYSSNYNSPGVELLKDMQFESNRQVYFEKFQQVSEHNNEFWRCVKIKKNDDQDYIVSINNLDDKYMEWGNSFMMQQKKMKIFENTESVIRLRGYGEDLLGNSLDVYGISVHLYDGDIEEIVFHRFDFYSHIVFYKAKIQITREVLQMIYFSMLRDENTLIYYNKIRQCVQQDVKGYFFNQTAIDKKLEKEILSERISNSDKKDSILPKVHYLIPRLELRTFLLLFDFYAVKYFDPVQDFLTAFKKKIQNENEKSGFKSTIYLDVALSNRFNSEFKEYCIKNGMVGVMYESGYNDLINGLLREIVKEFMNTVTD